MGGLSPRFSSVGMAGARNTREITMTIIPIATADSFVAELFRDSMADALTLPHCGHDEKYASYL
jgi:hypothetical protein